MKKIHTITRDITRHIIHVTQPIMANGAMQLPGALVEVDQDVAASLYLRERAIPATQEQISLRAIVVTLQRDTSA